MCENTILSFNDDGITLTFAEGSGVLCPGCILNNFDDALIYLNHIRWFDFVVEEFPEPILTCVEPPVLNGK